MTTRCLYPMPRQVSAQRVQEATWTCKGTPIGVGGMAGRGCECRNRCGALEQARGPRRYSRGLVADRSVACRSASSVPGGPPAGQGRRLAARMLRVCLAVGRWKGGGGAIESWGVGAERIQSSSRSTSPFRTAQTTISCLLPNPSLPCMW